MHFTQKENVLPSPSGDVKQSGESVENKDSGEKVTNEPIFTKENYPRIDASTAIQPLTEAIKDDFVGEDAEIIPYQRPVNSGSQSGMLQLVMKDTPMMQAPKTELTVGMGDLVDAIAQYDNSRYALGYSYYYYVNTMYKRDTIKMLAIDGVAPNKDTIRAGEYPIMTSGWLVFRKDEPEDSMIRKWVKALTSKRGASVIEAAGYVPAN